MNKCLIYDTRGIKFKFMCSNNLSNKVFEWFIRCFGFVLVPFCSRVLERVEWKKRYSLQPHFCLSEDV